MGTDALGEPFDLFHRHGRDKKAVFPANLSFAFRFGLDADQGFKKVRTTWIQAVQVQPETSPSDKPSGTYNGE